MFVLLLPGRISESRRWGKVTEELEEEVLRGGREEESLVFRCPSKVSPRRCWLSPERPHEGILEPAEGRDVAVVLESKLATS